MPLVQEDADTQQDAPVQHNAATQQDAPVQEDGSPQQDAGGQPTTVNLTGAVQKGPFVLGSSVSVSILDAALNPTGQVFNTQTINDLGEFAVTFTASGPVALEGVGYYYNEVLGTLSQSTLTLRALYIPSGPGVQHAYLNIITHLTVARIRALVSGGKTFLEAVAQAETELLEQLNITYPGYTPSVGGISMNMAGGDTDDNAYLLAVSSVLIQVARNRQGPIEANIQELLNQISQDFTDGTLSADIKSEITTALLQVKPDDIARKLAARLVSLGSTTSVPDMNRVLDQDRDDLANADDNCPLVFNPGQENRDGDPKGDVCDECLDTPCPDDCLPAAPESGWTTDVCVKLCAPWEDPFSTCGSDSVCVRARNVSVPSSQEVTLCASKCDPTALDPCLGNTGCFFLAPTTSPNPQWWGCAPQELLDDAPAGTLCGPYVWPPPVGCGAGLVCVGSDCGYGQVFGLCRCRPVCDPKAPASCGGQACVSVDAISTGGLELGACLFPPGTAYESCRPDGTCDAGLFCFATAEICSNCCLPAGGLNERCRPDGSCNQGFGCVTGHVDDCGPFINECCRP